MLNRFDCNSTSNLKNSHHYATSLALQGCNSRISDPFCFPPRINEIGSDGFTNRFVPTQSISDSSRLQMHAPSLPLSASLTSPPFAQQFPCNNFSMQSTLDAHCERTLNPCLENNNLEENINSTSDLSWIQSWTAHVKVERSKIQTFLKDPLCSKTALTQKQSKRIRTRLSKKRGKFCAKTTKEGAIEKDKNIDEWRTNLIEQEASKIRAEKMKKEADSILCEVHNKQDEVTHFKKLLEALHNLRKARITKGETHGYITTTEADKRFSKITDNLNIMLESQSNVYKVEQQILQVMMEESPSTLSQKTSIDRGKKKQLVNSHLELIHGIYFGNFDKGNLSREQEQFYLSFTEANKSLEILLQRRMEWDQFATDWNTPLSSSIPLGYVVPPLSPQGDWKLYHSTNKSLNHL